MIEVLHTENTKRRAFGWIQDPSDFRSLCDVVAVFVKGSAMHTSLVQDKIPRLVETRDGRNDLLAELTSDDLPLKLTYRSLVGTAFTPRSVSRCNGIVQAAVKGQKREFIVDWPADNFVRWAHALGFLRYDYATDTFSITPLGEQLVAASHADKGISEAERQILIDAVLSYPPAIRVLSLLSEDGAHLTKFEIGKQLGFIGEGGFTSQPQDPLVVELAQTTDPKRRNDMKTDWEGSSDKYARMIAKWLCNLGLAETVPKEICVRRGDREYKATISQAYMITLNGLRAYHAAQGNSRHRRRMKNVYYELFSPSGKDREYLRTRRSYIVKYLSEHRAATVEQLREYLSSVHITETDATIADDVRGLINIGLDIAVEGRSVVFRDWISDFSILICADKNYQKAETSAIKEKVREQLTHLSHEYLFLIDLAFDSQQSRMFEMKTVDLFVQAYGFYGEHLGGARKPDGVLYTTSQDAGYGVILDTKAYSDGYNLPIAQADEMSRYIRENQNRNVEENPNRWWERFDPSVKDFVYLFVSGSFKGRVSEQLKRIALTTHTDGAALSVAGMLLCANRILTGETDLQMLRQTMFVNEEYTAE